MKAKYIFMAAAAAAAMLPSLARNPRDTKSQTLSPEIRLAESPAPAWLDTAVIYEANLRQGTTTRDFKGLQKELPRLKNLGVDVVWLMPIHPISVTDRKGKLGSYYAVRDYKAINPEFGRMADLKNLVDEAHRLGMKVILDEVCNHTGTDNPWVKVHPEYYARNEKGEMYGPYDWTDVYKLDYTNPALRKAMIDVLQYWIRMADIDGYRCDVAFEVPTSFWEEARPKLQSIKPVMMLAEAAKPELLHLAFDADYAWPMKDLFNAVAATQGVNSWAKKQNKMPEPKTAYDIRKAVENERVPSRSVPFGGVHMNMVTNHDLNSWEGTEFDRYGEAAETFAMLSYTLPGIPMMYTGQEVGFNHAFEFFDKDSIMPDYTPNKYTDFYKKLNSLKHGEKSLSSRNQTYFYETGNKDLLVFDRSYLGDKPEQDEMVIVVANLSSKPQPFKVIDPEFSIDGMTDYFKSAPAKLPGELAPWQYFVFVKKK